MKFNKLHLFLIIIGSLFLGITLCRSLKFTEGLENNNSSNSNNNRATKLNKISDEIKAVTETVTETQIEPLTNETPIESQKNFEMDAESKKVKDVKISDTKETKTLSEREARKIALEEKKKRILAKRKAKLEALKRKRDSIRNNK